jgi:hypothetical protein
MRHDEQDGAGLRVPNVVGTKTRVPVLNILIVLRDAGNLIPDIPFVIRHLVSF